MHHALSELWTTIGHDTTNEVLIFTATDDKWIAEVDASSFKDVEQSPDDDQRFNVQIYNTLKVVENFVNDIEIPTICAIDGRGIHWEMAMMSDITCTPDFILQDDHFGMKGGHVPGDGMTMALQKVLGVKRGNYMSYTLQGIDAETCLKLGAVNEIVPREQVLDRAWELARLIMKTNRSTRRLTHHIAVRPWRELVEQNLRQHVYAEMYSFNLVKSAHDFEYMSTATTRWRRCSRARRVSLPGPPPGPGGAVLHDGSDRRLACRRLCRGGFVAAGGAAQVGGDLSRRLAEVTYSRVDERPVVLACGGEAQRKHTGCVAGEIDDGGRHAHESLDHLVDLDGVCPAPHQRQPGHEALMVDERIRRVPLQWVSGQQAIDVLGCERGEEHLSNWPVGQRSHIAHFAWHRHQGESFAGALPLVDGDRVVAVANCEDYRRRGAALQGGQRLGRRVQQRQRRVDGVAHLEQAMPEPVATPVRRLPQQAASL